MMPFLLTMPIKRMMVMIRYHVENPAPPDVQHGAKGWSAS